MYNSHRYSRAMNTSFQSALTIDAVRSIAPSAFAESAHESRSARYTYIPTSVIIEGLMKEGFMPFKAAQSRSRIEGKSEFTKHMLRFRHVDSMVNADGLFPEVVMVNSHDGTSAYKLFAGIFRMVCTNGLISGKTTGEIAVQHKGNIVHNVIEGSFEIIGQSRAALGVADTWGRLQLTGGEQQAFAAAAHHLRFADAEGTVSTPITPAQLLSPRRAEDSANANGFSNWRSNAPASDLWRTLNVVQENVIQGGLHGVARGTDARGYATRRNVTTRTVNGIDQDVKLNRAMWMLAEYMASQKGVTVAA